MALVLKDRVKEQTTTTGTGTITLGGTVSGFESFASVGDGNTTYYAIVNPAADEWEVGLGTYTAAGTTLSRDTILESSNSDAAVDFSAGTKDVFVTYPSDKAVDRDAADYRRDHGDPGLGRFGFAIADYRRADARQDHDQQRAAQYDVHHYPRGHGATRQSGEHHPHPVRFHAQCGGDGLQPDHRREWRLEHHDRWHAGHTPATRRG